MAQITLTSAIQYAKMSASFYQEYLIIDEAYQKALLSYEEGLMEDYRVFALLTEKEEKAIAAVVFQAFAIEAYINLLGITVFGEQVFFDKYDNERKRMSTYRKAEIIFKELSVKYPEEHYVKLKKLFDKRDALVHQKPHRYTAKAQPYDYEHPEENYKDYLKIMEPFNYLLSDLEEEMDLFHEFQENVRILRGAEKELIEEIMDQEIIENIREINDAVQPILGIKIED